MSAFWQLLLDWLATGGVFLAWIACVLLCLGGLVLSALSISGTWLVLAAGGVAALLTSSAEFPHGLTLLGMAALCASVDIIEWFAASWGVRRRGGSRTAGWLALLGSIEGMILGTLLIPIPIAGGLIGMMVGSFTLVYWAEKHRLQQTTQATHIATGAVLAGISVLFLKITVTATLVLWLAIGLLI